MSKQDANSQVSSNIRQQGRLGAEEGAQHSSMASLMHFFLPTRIVHFVSEMCHPLQERAWCQRFAGVRPQLTSRSRKESTALGFSRHQDAAVSLRQELTRIPTPSPCDASTVNEKECTLERMG